MMNWLGWLSPDMADNKRSIDCLDWAKDPGGGMPCGDPAAPSRQATSSAKKKDMNFSILGL